MKRPLPTDPNAILDIGAGLINELHGQDLLSVLDDDQFNELTRLTALFFKVPYASITIMTEDKLLLRARVGIEACELPADGTFCEFAVRQTDVLVVTDASVDSRFCAHSLTQGSGGFKFYAGAPIISSKGVALGTLCILDIVPRDFDTSQIAILKQLSKQISSQIEIQATNQILEIQKAELSRLVKALRSHERLIETQRAQMTQNAKMSALGEMAGGIAHEINNPLAIIQGSTQQLKSFAVRGRLDEAAVLKASARIENTVSRIAKIVRGLRTFAKDGVDDPFENVTVGGLFSDTLDLCRTRFVSNEVSLIVGEPPAAMMVEGRVVQLSQVLLNLLNNAFDAVEPLAEKWVRLDATVRNGRLSITVTDSGGGVPLPARQKLMQPFFTTKEVGKGTGLGLSISRGIIETHGGTLSYNELSTHTQFVIDLPLRQTQEKAA